MRILMRADHYPTCSARYMTDAFKRLGHDVHHFGADRGAQVWGLTLPKETIWKSDWDWPNQYIMREQWDLVIAMDTDPVVLDEAQWYADPRYADLHPTRKVICYTVDNHVRRVRRAWFEHHFLAHHDGPSQPVRQADEEWLPCGYDPAVHVPSPIPWAEREFDVAIVGVMYANRMRLVNELQTAGLKVFAATGLVYDQYVQAYHNARISLCASIAGDVAQRVFETAAMGCVVMSDPCADFQRLRPNGLWLYDPRDAAADVKKILSDPAMAQTQIAQSMAWVKPHTWDARAARIVEWYTERNGSEQTTED